MYCSYAQKPEGDNHRVIPNGLQEIQSVSAEAILGMIDDSMIHLQLDANQSGQDQWSWSNLGMEKSSI